MLIRRKSRHASVNSVYCKRIDRRTEILTSNNRIRRMARTPHSLLSATALLLIILSAPAAFAAEPIVTAPKQNLPAIVVTDAVARTLVDKVVATGTVKAVEEVYIQPLVDGLPVKALNADVGDKVTDDRTLATV